MVLAFYFIKYFNIYFEFTIHSLLKILINKKKLLHKSLLNICLKFHLIKEPLIKKWNYMESNETISILYCNNINNNKICQKKN